MAEEANQVSGGIGNKLQDSPLPSESSESYENLKAEIIKRYGKDYWDERGRPANESAKRIWKLQSANGVEAMRKKRKEKMLSKAKEIETPLETDLELPDEFFLPFEVDEQKVAREYFKTSRPNLAHIERVTEVSYSKVRAFILSKEFLLLEGRVCQFIKERLPLKAMRLFDHLSDKSSDVSQTILEDSGYLRSKVNSEINIYNSPRIEDPRAEEELKKLGDRLANMSPTQSQLDTIECEPEKS